MNQYLSQEAKIALFGLEKSLGASSLRIVPVRVCDHCGDRDKEAFPYNYEDYNGVSYQHLCVECYVALSADPIDDWKPICEICGLLMEWEDCYNCTDGYIDLYDEDPLWYDKNDTERCDACGGDSGWWYCPNTSNHSKERDHETKSTTCHQ